MEKKSGKEKEDFQKVQRKGLMNSLLMHKKYLKKLIVVH